MFRWFVLFAGACHSIAIILEWNSIKRSIIFIALWNKNANVPPKNISTHFTSLAPGFSMQCACISGDIAGKVTKVHSIISILSFSQKREHSTSTRKIQPSEPSGNISLTEVTLKSQILFVYEIKWHLFLFAIMAMFDKKGKISTRNPEGRTRSIW